MKKERWLGIRIEDELRENFLRTIKAKQDEDMSSVIRTLIKQYIKNATPEITGVAAK